MELSSTTGSGLWVGRLWNSQLKLAQDNPVPSSPYQCCDWPNRLKPPHITETFFSCHITSASMRTDSVTLKMEAVRSSETLAGLTTTQYRNSKDGYHLLKFFKNEVVLLYWNCKRMWIPTTVILCDGEGLNSCDYSDLVSLDGTLCIVVDMYECGRRTCCLHLQCSLMMEAVGSSRVFGTCLLPHYMVSYQIKPLSQTTTCTKGILQCMHTSSNGYWCIWGAECHLAGCRPKPTCAEKENVKT